MQKRHAAVVSLAQDHSHYSIECFWGYEIGSAQVIADRLPFHAAAAAHQDKL